MTTPTYRKKLIEVALPLEAINRESAREKSIRHGHPSTLHLWWARRPLAACRAMLFASLVDDPSSRPEEFPTEEAQDAERQRLFRLIEELVKWDNSTNETVLAAARAEILRSTDGNPPPVLDPFCGGGSIPLEAKRLGLEAHGSDLNPVPVLITKALIEIPPKFDGRPPVNPDSRRSLARAAGWKGAAGLAADIRHYGSWMRDEAERRVGHLYPKVRLPASDGGHEATVIAWLWARTVACPNPACGVQMPLVRSFALSTKAGKERSVEPVVERSGDHVRVRFRIHTGRTSGPSGTVDRGIVRCVACGETTGLTYVRAEAQAGRMKADIMAVVGAGDRQRVYLPVTEDQEEAVRAAAPSWKPDAPVPTPNHDVDRLPMYGMNTWGDAFTNRQAETLATFCDLIPEVRELILRDALAAWGEGDTVRLEQGGASTAAYADAVATYLGFVISRSVDRGSTICTWDSSPKMEALRNTFARQAIPMTWDFAEGNPFSDSSGSWSNNLEWTSKAVAALPSGRGGFASQQDAADAAPGRSGFMVATDPPYYDNISYADLADFFYVWLRRSLGSVYPQLLATLLTPKSEELVANSYRHGGDRSAAESFFQRGFVDVFRRLQRVSAKEFPLTVFYAFKQTERSSEQSDGALASTGWEKLLEGLLEAGFLVDGTWPVRSELTNRMVASGTNALASSIVLVCRARPETAQRIPRRQFLSELQRELPLALRALQHGNIAPVDLAQAAIGPGMAVFSRYLQVLESDGSPMLVRTALELINQVLAETLAEQEGALDADTRWAVTWFDESGFSEGNYGRAELLATAKNTSMAGLVDAGIVTSARGKVRLLRRDELAAEWDPATDARRTVWEATHHLIRALEHGGEQRAASLLARLGADAERARDLAYRLYTTCERRGWAQDAQAYNSLVVAWPDLTRLAAAVEPTLPTAPAQATLAL